MSDARLLEVGGENAASWDTGPLELIRVACLLECATIVSVSSVNLGWRLDAKALRSQVSIGSRALDAGPVVNRGARHDCIQLHLQDTFSDRLSGVKFLFALLGFAALAGELGGAALIDGRALHAEASAALYSPVRYAD